MTGKLELPLTKLCDITKLFSCAMLSAFVLLGFSSAKADNVFVGPGLFTNTTLWSQHRWPTNTVEENIRMRGLCGATNVVEQLQGGKWCHLGYGGDGWLDVKDCDMLFRTFRIACGKNRGVYRQSGGNVKFDDGVRIGYEADYPEAGIDFDGVTVVNKDIQVGAAAPKNSLRGAAYLRATNCTFTSSSEIRTMNGGLATFKDCRISGGYLRAQAGTSISLVDSSFTGSNSGLIYAGYSSGGVGEIAFTNSFVYGGEKVYLGAGSKCYGILDFKDSFWTNRWQVYVGNAAGSTGVVHFADSDAKFESDLNIGYGTSSYGEMVFDSGSKVVRLGSYAHIGVGSNAVGRLVFNGVDWSKIAGPATDYRFAEGLDSVGQVVYRDIAGRRAYTLATVFTSANTNGYAETVFDNAHSYNTGNAYFGQANRDARVVVCNGATFDIERTGDVWMPNDAGSRVAFSVTNSPMFRIDPGSNTLKHEKDRAKLDFTFVNSTVYFCTNATAYLASGAGSSSTIEIAGSSSVACKWLRCGSGDVTLNLNGGEFAVYYVYDGAPAVNFNGGALATRTAHSAWLPSSAVLTVCDGGAVFDARHNVTIPGVLRHGGTAAKDGGVTKKGAATLTLSSTTAHEFTGDVVVEEGTLVATAFSNWTLAAGQKIGGAGTLKVGSGFTAGGVRYDVSQANGLVVDGAVAFAPGSSVELVGFDGTEGPMRRTLLTANGLSGVENIDSSAVPNGYRLVAKGGSLILTPNVGFSLVFK